jgi:hypothetical protein
MENVECINEKSNGKRNMLKNSPKTTKYACNNTVKMNIRKMECGVQGWV